MKVPLVDLAAQHAVVAEEVMAGFARVLAQTSFILGEEVGRFENAFASFSGTQHCVSLANGTDAIELLLRAIGVGPGDEVILPVNTFIATGVAVMRAGATPVLVDAEPHSYLIDVAAVERAITAKTKALLPVHLYGQLADMPRLTELAVRAGVHVLEDAAQAQGASRDGRRLGQDSIGAATSFYPGKNLGAYGDGGAVLTNSDSVAAKVRALRNYGSEQKYQHPEVGFNSRLDTLQAVVLLAKLQHLEAWNQLRREAARRYDERLAALPQVRRPQTVAGNVHVWHLYVVRVPKRDTVLARLQEAGIGAGIHYPIPLHLQGAFRHLGYQRGDFPIAEAAAGELLTLPLYPMITEAQQDYVVDTLQATLASA